MTQTTVYTYDSANRLVNAGSRTYTWSNNGNLLTTGVMTNVFDAANRLTSTTRASTTLQVAYNGLNDRVRQTVGATTTSFILDSAGGLPEVISTTRGTTYLHLPGVIMAQNATGQRVYLLPDGLGSIRQVMSGTTVVAQRDFDPYGNPISTPSVSTPPYGFTGEWWEQDAQLLHLRARWYAPGEGIFLSKDPWEGDITRPDTLHGYSYAANNPITYRDASGLDYLPEFDRYTCDDPRAGSGSVYQYDKATGTWGLWPCIVDPNNMQRNGRLPIPPVIPPSPKPPIKKPAKMPTSLGDCPVVPGTGMTRCQEFVQEVQRIIASSKAQGMTDGMTVMILAQYYSAIRIQSRDIELFGQHPLFPGNPALPGGYFRNQDQELYPIRGPEGQAPTPEQIARYGFKKIFWNNTHHYFADFYHSYFLGDNISFVGAYGREGLQWWSGANNPEETRADLALHWVAKRHAHQVSPYVPWFMRNTPYVAPLTPGQIEILPGLLRSDACEALSWILPVEGQ